jgi:mRNA turnover protein 4
MPKAKRQKLISLTQVKKRVGVERKQELAQTIRDNVAKYHSIYVFTTENMRNTRLKELRGDLQDSRFFLGKNTIAARVLGKDEASALKPEFHKISQILEGECGLLFTNQSKEEIVEFFKNYREADYARSGFVPIETVERHPGPIEMTHVMEPTLRQLGMTTSLNKGVIILEKEYTLCTAGQPITPENAKLLKLFDMKLADFQVVLKAVWHDGTFEEL